MKRPLVVVLVGAVAVIAAVVVFAFTGLGATVKAVVERVGSRATGTEVTLSSADISLSSGEARLAGLVVGNPKGFGTKCCFELGDIRCKLDTSSVTSDVIVVEELVIDGPHVTYELGPGGSNVGVIQDNVTKFGGGDARSRAPSEATKDDDAGGRRFVIRDLRIVNGRMDAATTLVQGKSVGAKLGEIRLKDVGTAEGGASSAEVARRILLALSEASIDAASRSGLDAVKEGLGEKLGGAIKKVFGK
jgi:hypothetical protein